MAQGLSKTGPKKKKSAASSHKRTVKKLAKGRKTFQAKGRKVSLSNQEAATSRAICKKNEKLISAKAVSAGNTFFLNDIKEAGKKEVKRLKRNQERGEMGGNDLGKRLKGQLRKLGQEN